MSELETPEQVPGMEPVQATRTRVPWTSLRVTIDWRVAIGQVLLTALGVALALAGSAWWSDRQERVRERSELRSMLDAARVSERRMRQAIHEDSISYAIDSRLRDSLTSVPDDSLDGLVVDARWWSDARPVVVPFAAIMQNGDIHLVRDTRLRTLMPAYVGEMEARTRTLDALTQVRIEFLANTRLRLGAGRSLPRRTQAVALRSNPWLLQEVEGIRFINGNSLGNFRLMLRATTELRKELERVLGEQPVPFPTPRIRRDSF